MVIFVKSVQRCIALAQLLVEQNFPAIAIHRGMPQEERYGTPNPPQNHPKITPISPQYHPIHTNTPQCRRRSGTAPQNHPKNTPMAPQNHPNITTKPP